MTIVTGILSILMDTVVGAAKRLLTYGVLIGLMIAMSLFIVYNIATSVIH